MGNSRNNLKRNKSCLKNVFKVLIFLFILGTVSACGSNFMYNLIDTFFVRTLDRYFDLSRDQKKFLKERLEYKLELHRTEGIPEHIAFLKSIQDKVQKGLDDEAVSCIIQSLNQQVDLISNRFFDDLVEFLMTLQDEQIDHFEKVLAEQNEKEKKAQQKLSEREAEDNSEDVIKSLEGWLGPLSDDQKKEILQLFAQMAAESKQLDNPEQEYKERLEGQQKFIKALRTERNDREKLEKALHEVINSARVKPEDESVALFTDYVLKIDRLVTQKQRNHFNKKLDGWIDKLNDLIDT